MMDRDADFEEIEPPHEVRLRTPQWEEYVLEVPLGQVLDERIGLDVPVPK